MSSSHPACVHVLGFGEAKGNEFSNPGLKYIGCDCEYTTVVAQGLAHLRPESKRREGGFKTEKGRVRKETEVLKSETLSEKPSFHFLKYFFYGSIFT